MNTEQSHQDSEVKESVSRINLLNSVTPLSKYLALALFIILPFIGGYIGYVYAPEKTIEIERIVYRETLSSSTVYQVPNRVVIESMFEIENGRLMNFFDTTEVAYTFSVDQLNQLGLGDSGEENFKTSSAVRNGNTYGEYYIVVSDVDRYGSCEFSNRIFSLDTNSNLLNLLYEESNNTLALNDFRSCDKEMILMGTEEDKLIIEYHALERGGICDQNWGSPEKTWFLDTKYPSNGTQKFEIPEVLFLQAQSDMKECVEQLNDL